MTHQRSIRRIALATTVLASGLLFVAAAPAIAQNLPDTGNLTTVTSGLSGGAPGSTNPAISTSGAAGAQTMRVDLRDNRTIMTWGGAGFNVAAGNTVDFKDTRATSGVTGRTDNIAVLNRDISGSRSNILGNLHSDPNVAVYLINSEGILFGSSSAANTGSLFASTLDLTDQNFLDNPSSLDFSGTSRAGIELAAGAQISTAATTSTNGGRIGDLVLIGATVFGNGAGALRTLNAVNGDVALIAAGAVTIQNAPGSPLSFRITAPGRNTLPTTVVDMAANITARNVTVATLKNRGGNLGQGITMAGSITATGATLSDRGVILTAGFDAPGVTIGYDDPSLSQMSFLQILGTVNSARDLVARTDGGVLAYKALNTTGRIDIDSEYLNGYDTTTITGSDILLPGSVYVGGKVTATQGDITMRAPLLGGGGATFVGGAEASGNITMTDGSFSSGNDLLAGGAINLTVDQGRFDGKVHASGSITIDMLSLFDRLTFNGDVTSDGDIRITAPGHLAGGLFSAGGSLYLQGNNSFKVRSATGVTGVTIISDGNGLPNSGVISGIAQLGSATATGMNADLYVRALGLVNYEASGRPGAMTAGRNVDIIAPTVDLTFVEGTRGHVNITATGSPATSSGGVRIDKIVAGTDVAITGEAISIIDATAIGNLSLTSNGTTQLGSGTLPSTIAAGGNVTIMAGGSAQVRSNITVGGDLNITGTNLVLGSPGPGTQAGAQVKARGAANLVATTGGIRAVGDTLLQSNSDGVGSEAVTVSAATGITFDATTTLSGGTARQSDVRIRTSGTDTITLGALTGRGLLGSAGSAAFTTGLSTSANIVVNGVTSLVDTLKLTGANVRTAQVTAGNIDITSSHRAEGTSLTATGTINVQAAEAIMFSDLLAPGGITLTAPGVPTLGSGYITFSSAKALGSDADVIISAGRSVTSLGINAPVQAGRDVLIRGGTAGTLSPGELGVNLGSIKAGRDLTIVSPGITGFAIEATTGSVSLTGTGGALKAFSIVAGGSITANGTSIGIRQVFTPNAAVTLTADAGNLILGETGYASFAGGGDMALTANGGSIRIGGNLTTGGDLTIAGDRVDIIGYISNPLSIRAKGALTIDGRAGGISASANGGVILSNSDGIGEEALTLQSSGGISMLIDLLAGTARQSDIRLRYSADKPLQFFGISARSLLGASGSAPFTNGINTTSPIVISEQIDLVNSLSLSGSQVGIKAINIRNGNVDIRATGENLELSAPIVASGDVFLDAGARGLLIDPGGSVSGRNVVLSMGDAFANLRGSDAITASGHWVVYSQSPSFEPIYETMVEFGGLDSGATALWGATYATRAPSTISGNRYVFAVKPTLTFSTGDLTKIYGTDLTGSASLPLSVTGYQPGVAGAFLADTAATAYAGNPLITSPGFAARATVAGGPYATSIAQGSLTSDAGYAFAFTSPGMVTVTPKALTGTVAIDTKTYDGTKAATGSVALADVVSGDSVGTTGSIFAFLDKNAAAGKTVTVTGTMLTGADAGNYTLTMPASALGDILKKALTATVTVDNKTYDGTTAATGMVGLSGTISDDSVGTTGSAFSFTDKNAGTGKTVNVTGTTLNGTDAGNYTLTIPATALADILKKALTGTIIADSKTYDGTTAATGSVGLSGTISGDSVGTAGSVFTFADKNAGTGKTVTITGTTLNGVDAGNYTLTLPASALADILKKALTGSVIADTKTYDGTTAATGSVSLSGAISGDDVGTGGSAFTFADKNAGAGKTINVSGTMLSGADASNYTLTLPASALADILKKALTGTITADSKTYDGTTAATGAIGLSGTISGDSVGTTGTSFAFADKNAGTGKTVTVSGTTLNGADAGNYTLTLPASALADILKKALTGTIAVDAKTYDGTTNATGKVGLSGVISGDTVGTGGSVFAFADRNAGAGKTVSVNGTALNGADAGNYTLTIPASALGEILKKALTGTVTVSSKTYDGTTAATGSVGLSGVLSGDNVGTTGSVFTFADRNAGTAKTVTVTGTALNGADGGNYTLTLPASAVADILKRAIAVTADDRSKHEGESDPTLTFTVTGGSLATGDALAGALARAAGEDKGDYAITQGTLSGGQNYQLTFHDGVFTITERRIPETVAQPLRSVVLPNQLPDLSPPADGVTVDGGAVCAQDPNCVSAE